MRFQTDIVPLVERLGEFDLRIALRGMERTMRE
jgi:hypothetical protein